MLGRRIDGLTLVAALALTAAGCNTSPPNHEERMLKAAGVTTIKIRCHKDVWARTGEEYNIEGKITTGDNGIITVEISGPQLVDLLDSLDYRFDHTDGHEDDLVAKRLYNALAPVVDGIKATPRTGDPVPEVVVDDAAAPSASRTPSPSGSPTP